MFKEIDQVELSEVFKSKEILCHVKTDTYFVPDELYDDFSKEHYRCFSHSELLILQKNNASYQDIQDILKFKSSWGGGQLMESWSVNTLPH